MYLTLTLKCPVLSEAKLKECAFDRPRVNKIFKIVSLFGCLFVVLLKTRKRRFLTV